MTGPAPLPRHRVEVASGVARITLDNPSALNALRTEDFRAVAATLSELDARPDVRAIGLTGAGRAFCAGAELGAPGAAVDSRTLDAAADLVRTVMTATTPVVALVNGVAAGAGCPLALAADYTLAHEDAFFSLTFTRIGLMPDAGATALVTASIGRARALRMTMTGERLSARQAADWGLVAETAAATEFGARAAEVLSSLAASSTPALAETTAAINASAMAFDDALLRESTGQAALLGGEDFPEGVTAFLEKRTPRFRGHPTRS